MNLTDRKLSWLMPVLCVASIAAVKPDLRLVDALEHRDKQSAMSLLEQHVDVDGRDSAEVLKWACVNSALESGIRSRPGIVALRCACR